MNDGNYDVAVVLPPREHFSAIGGGAIALLVHRLTRAPSQYRRIVVGARSEEPFGDVAFRPILPVGLLGRPARRYAAGVARELGQIPWLEVHNRPDVALALAAGRAASRVSLFLHNDPAGMRGLRTPAERARAAVRLAGIVCVSGYLAERMRDGAPSANVSVLANCIDRAALPRPILERERLILFAGRLVADKGADSFVAACARILPDLPGWRAMMVGADRFSAASPTTPFIDRLMPQAVAAGIELTGYLQHAKVLDAMARAAIVVVPSRWQEPFGLTALEAMASGAALVCSNRGGLAEVTGDVALRCDPDDPASIASAIRHLVDGPEERASRGRLGMARAAAFDLPLAAAALDAYREGLIRG